MAGTLCHCCFAPPPSPHSLSLNTRHCNRKEQPQCHICLITGGNLMICDRLQCPTDVTWTIYFLVAWRPRTMQSVSHGVPEPCKVYLMASQNHAKCISWRPRTMQSVSFDVPAPCKVYLMTPQHHAKCIL